MPSRHAFLILLAAALALGLGLWWYLRVLPHGPVKVAFADLPGWHDTAARAALSAFRRSCAHGASRGFEKVCARAATTIRDPRAFFETNFTPYAIGEGLVTGYYEPLLNGSRERHGAFQTPVYGLPDDLVMVDLGQFRPEWKGERIAGRVEGHRLTPFETRAEIDAHPPANTKVLFWCDDPVAAFFLHIQGSGRVRLDDGRMVRVTYAGQNGRPYTAVGRTLIAEGALAREEVSLQSIRAWLKAHPGAARRVMETDASYVFFREEPIADPGLGPSGTEGVALTPKASIAVDAAQNAFGTPMFIEGKGLFVAQDTGGAIKGRARADVFFGFGGEAEAAAGGLKDQSKFYILLPNDLKP